MGNSTSIGLPIVAGFSIIPVILFLLVFCTVGDAVCPLLYSCKKYFQKKPIQIENQPNL